MCWIAFMYTLIDILLKHQLVSAAGTDSTLSPSQQTISIHLLLVLRYRLCCLIRAETQSPESVVPWLPCRDLYTDARLYHQSSGIIVVCVTGCS